MARNPVVSDPDTSFTLDASLLQQRKSANLHRLYTRQIPALRTAGFVILCVIALLQAWRGDVPFSQSQVLWLVGTNLSFAAIGWAVLRFGYGRTGKLDLSLLLFHLDLLIWLANLYQLERTNLFFAYLLLIRVVDQLGVGFRRALYFNHVVTAAYLGYSLWVSMVEPARAAWADRIGIAATMYLLGLYIAFTAIVTERLRNRTRQAMHTARALVSNL